MVLTLHLASDPVEPVDVEMATEDVGDMPMVGVCHIM